MADIALIYGSTTGNTSRVADIINENFDNELYIEEINDKSKETIEKYKYIIFGISTWNVGELEYSWEEFFPILDEIDFTDKKIAIYGLGDQETYPDTYLDAVGILYDKLIEKNAEIIGFWENKDYSFEQSLALRNDKFTGLALDEDNQPELTEPRVKKWVNLIKKEFIPLQILTH